MRRTKNVAAIGAAFDAQDDYHAFDADAFVDYPSGPGAVTAQLAYNHFDGGATFVTLPRQNAAWLETDAHAARPRSITERRGK